MKVLITGASSGIGRDMVVYLSKKGYKVIAVGRNQKKLDDLEKETGAQSVNMDLSNVQNCLDLYNQVGEVDILINNAGFGNVGEFWESDLEKEINMINTNITALHILTKMYLKDMVKKDKGYILNVGSIAGFMPGPLMATYYSTKAYVVRFTQSIHRELKMKKSGVYIGVLCPGPVDTGFNDVAGTEFNFSSLSSKYVAKYAIDKMFKRKLVIIPGFTMKIARLAGKIVPDRVLSFVDYYLQAKKK